MRKQKANNTVYKLIKSILDLNIMTKDKIICMGIEGTAQ